MKDRRELSSASCASCNRPLGVLVYAQPTEAVVDAASLAQARGYQNLMNRLAEAQRLRGTASVVESQASVHSRPFMKHLLHDGTLVRLGADTLVAARPIELACRSCYLHNMAVISGDESPEPEGLRGARDAARQKRSAALARAREMARARDALGLDEYARGFECNRCGRWADIRGAATAHSRLVRATLHVSEATFNGWRSSARQLPLRPALLQRDYRRSYEAAVAALDRANEVGLLDKVGKGFAPSPPLCESCYGQLEAATNEPKHAPAANGRDPIPPQLRFRVLQRDSFRCQYCGRSAREGAVLHLDHVVPVAAGGETSEANLITACDTCNMGKTDHPVL